MASLKSLIGQTATYGISTILGRIVNILLVPFYTTAEILSVGQYGVVTGLYAFVAFFNVVFQFGMETTYFRFANLEKESSAFNKAQSFVLVLGVGVGALLFLGRQQIMDFAGYPSYANVMAMMVGILFIDASCAVPFARLRQRKQSGKFAAIRFSNIILNVGLNLFFLLICPLSN